MGVMAQQAQHDEIGIKSVQAVTDVLVVIGLSTGIPDVLHDLVLALAGDFVTREHDLRLLPIPVLGHFLIDEVLELHGELGHEFGS